MNERFTDQDPRAVIAEQAREQIDQIEQTAIKIGGEDAELDDVFPHPPDDRDTAPDPGWDERQEAEGRALGEALGYAAEKNVPSGVRRAVLKLEGGKVWKMESEAEAIADEEDVEAVVVSGSPYRLIGEDEKAHKVAQFEEQLPKDMSDKERDEEVAEYAMMLEGEEFTEYDEAIEIAQGMVESLVGDTLPYGYEVSEGNPLVHEATGQFVRWGKNSDGKDVVTMRVDQGVDEETGKPKNRPNPMRRMGIISDILTAQGDTTTPVVFMTSNAYASRKVDALRAGLGNDRQYGVAMYGRETLARVKGEPIQPGARLNQLPGDIRQTHDKLRQLLTEIQS